MTKTTAKKKASKTVPKKNTAAAPKKTVTPPPMPAAPFNPVLPQAPATIKLADGGTATIEPTGASVHAIPPPIKLVSNVTPIAPKVEKTPQRARRKIHIAFNMKEITKIEKRLGEVAVGELKAKSEDELRQYLFDLSIHEEETFAAKRDDEELKEARNAVAELNAPYNETMKGIKERRRWVVSELQTRGITLER